MIWKALKSLFGRLSLVREHRADMARLDAMIAENEENQRIIADMKTIIDDEMGYSITAKQAYYIREQKFDATIMEYPILITSTGPTIRKRLYVAKFHSRDDQALFELFR